MKDATPIFLGVALIATLLFQYHEKVTQCEYKFQGFKDGVIYGR
jgi:hypothetical protein